MSSSASIPKYTSTDGAVTLLRNLGAEFAVVANPQYVYPPFDLYPFAPPRIVLERGLMGAVMDMDGTTTTTEPLCIHSLETMVRRITGRQEVADWAGLDHDKDFPHIIGNSTTRHVEYLVQAYGEGICPAELQRWHILSSAWTLGQGADEGRKKEVRANLSALGVDRLMELPEFGQLMNLKEVSCPAAVELLNLLESAVGGGYQLDNTAAVVRASVDIYYQRYHQILAEIHAGRGDDIAAEVFGQSGGHLIEPMPGIGVYLSLIKGWLGADAAACAPELLGHLNKQGLASGLTMAATEDILRRLGAHFSKNPARAAIVTSSIEYEARIVLSEVFRVLRQQISEWPLPEEKRASLSERFAEPTRLYDGFVTASDSSEIRLKPHRDLYSLALHRIGLLPEQFANVAGFEDSESGTIAIRAAGIALCCALPFSMTRGHTFQAATHTCNGGLPEVILCHQCFLPEHALA